MKKYYINFYFFCKRLIPYFLRKNKFLAILHCLIEPLQTMNSEMTTIVDRLEYRLNHSSQIIYFEKYLNEIYLCANSYPNNIHIIDTANIEFFYLWNYTDKQKPKYFNNYSDGAQPLFLKNANAYIDGSVSFVVRIPSDVVSGIDIDGRPFNLNVLNKRINDVRIAGESFEISYF